jgi:hypothetical protein
MLLLATLILFYLLAFILKFASRVLFCPAILLLLKLKVLLMET